MLNKNWILALVILIFHFVIFADVPPDRGEIRVNPPLSFTPSEDFSEYRFFLVSPIDIEEIQVKKDETKIFDSENRGGAKRFVRLVAVLKTELKDEKLSKEQEKSLLNYSAENPSFKVIELIKHSFQKDIPISERVNWNYPQYQIEKSGDSIKATIKHDISPKISQDEESIINNNSKIFMIVAGLLLTFAIIGIGILLFRKK